jgi:hypothetical protein
MRHYKNWLSQLRWLVTVTVACCCTIDLRATILTFDETRVSGAVIPTVSGNAVPQDYGDRVGGSPQTVPGGQFTYGNGGEGFTPNVTLDYSVAGFPSGGVSLWQGGYGDLTNVLFGNQNSIALRVQLTADPGFDVQLYHFDLGGWPNADYMISSVRVLELGATLFSMSNVLIEGDLTGPRHTPFDFSVPLVGNQLLIEIDYNNLSGNQQDNIGIDNVRFGQNPLATPIPEPSTGLLFSVAILAGVVLRRTVWRRQ